MARNVWLMQVHSDVAYRGLALELTRKHSRLAIGWGRTGDLSNISRDCLYAEYIKGYPERDTSPTVTPSLWNFYSNMQVGDLVLVDDPSTSGIAVFEIAGGYEWTRDDNERLPGDFWHHRPVFERLDLTGTEVRQGRNVANGEALYAAVRLLTPGLD